MPLPWKKARVPRIAQLVADLQAPKHGGSLVVQTGFPNSLIDLFVKNRDRLKNKPPSRKKNKKNKKNDTNSAAVEVSDPEILSLSLPPPPTTPPPSPSSRFVNSGSFCFWGTAVSRIESHGCRQSCSGAGGDVDGDLVVDDGVVVVAADDDEKDHVNVKKSGSSGVFVAILKLLIAVVVAVATKRLAVGVTLSAFVLLFIEYVVGKRVVVYFESCSKTLANWRFLIRRDEIVESESCALIKEGLDFDGDGIVNEIEIEGNKTDVVVVQDDQIRATEPDSDMLNHDKRLGYEEETGINKKEKKKKIKEFMEEEDEDGVGDITVEHKQPRRSRRAKLKAKVMKNLVPNKFRDSKKDKNCKGREPEMGTPEVSTSEYRLSICEDQENGLGKQIEIDENNSWHSSSEQKQCEEDEEKFDQEGGRRSSSSCAGEMITARTSEKMRIGKNRNLRSLILILLILAGLVGGRSIALVLTFLWWLCLKSVGTLKSP